MLMTPQNDSGTRKKAKGDSGEDDDAEAARLLSEDPMDWMLKNEQVSNMLSDVRDHELPNKLISMIQDMNYKAADTDCILLLLCKLKPLLWNMQKAVNNVIVGDAKKPVDEGKSKEKDDRTNAFFKFLPSSEDFINNGMECEESFKTCKLF